MNTKNCGKQLWGNVFIYTTVFYLNKFRAKLTEKQQGKDKLQIFNFAQPFQLQFMLKDHNHKYKSFIEDQSK